MKYDTGIDAAIKYLDKKKKKKESVKIINTISWVVAMLATWVIVYQLYYGF